jgi:hypothetical protein
MFIYKVRIITVKSAAGNLQSAKRKQFEKAVAD